MWDLPRSGIEPESTAWPGGLFTTEPPGKPLEHFVSYKEVRFNISLHRVKIDFLEKVVVDAVICCPHPCSGTRMTHACVFL